MPTLHRDAAAGLPYRRGVGVMVLNRDGQVLVARRIDMPSEAWQMPQGGIDAGESPIEAAQRELCEEIGTCNGEFLGESRDWYSYDLPAELAGSCGAGASADRPRNGSPSASPAATPRSTSRPRRPSSSPGSGSNRTRCRA